MRVRSLMIKDPITVKVDAEIDDAARLIHYNKIGGLPVVDEGQRLLGIITVADIMAAFIELMGVLKSSSRIDIVLGQDPEAFEEVSRIISSKGGKIISVGMLPQSNRKENIYFFRLKKRRIGKITDALGEAGYTVTASME